MRFFLDTWISELGAHRPIDLISIGIVSEDGREYYAISSEFDELNAQPYVRDSFVAELEADIQRKTLAEIKQDIIAFVGDEKPLFTAWYASFNWVAFCQIFGGMHYLPSGWGLWCYDLKQLAYDKDDPDIPLHGAVGKDSALSNARLTQAVYEHLRDYSPSDAQHYAEDFGVPV